MHYERAKAAGTRSLYPSGRMRAGGMACLCGKPVKARGMCGACWVRAKRQDPAYRAETNAQARKSARKRRQADPTRFRAEGRARYARDPASFKHHAKNRKARVKGAEGITTAAEREEIVRFWNSECAYCGAPYAHMDHVVPIARGGTNWPDNLVPACAPCNLAKNDKSVIDFLAWKAAA